MLGHPEVDAFMFQSLIGRLGTATWAARATASSVFQSLIGRLGTVVHEDTGDPLGEGFNPS